MITDPPYGVGYDPSCERAAALVPAISRGARCSTTIAPTGGRRTRCFPGDVAYVWHGLCTATSLPPAGGLRVAAARSDRLGQAALHLGPRRLSLAARDLLVRGARRQGSHWQGDRTQTTVWEISNNNPFGNPQHEPSWGHGTQKPVECMRRPIANNSRPARQSMTRFLGSGTSLIAAEMTGRVCYGVELNPAYVDVVVRRWQGFTGRAAMHQASGQSFDERAQRQDYDQSGAAHGEKKHLAVNDAVRERVRHLAGIGLRQDDIAKIIGCSPKTLPQALTR